MKNKLKDTLITSLGAFGLVIWYLLSFATMFAPLWFIDLPSFWIILILTMALMIPFIGEIANLALWIQSFLAVISEPIDGLSIFYFCVLALYVATTLLPFVIQLVINIIALLVNALTHKRH